MSRTDVHRSWQVQLDDPHNRHLFYRFATWPWQMDLLPIKNLGCGCPRCTDHFGRRWARRQDRHVARRALRDAVAQYAGGSLDEDLPLPHRPSVW